MAHLRAKTLIIKSVNKRINHYADNFKVKLVVWKQFTNYKLLWASGNKYKLLCELMTDMVSYGVKICDSSS